MTSSPRHYQYYLVMGPDFYGSVAVPGKSIRTGDIILQVRTYTNLFILYSN